MKFRKEQIERIFTGYVNLLTLSTNGTTVNATTSIGTALTTAGFGGGSVANVRSTSESTVGLIVSPTERNKVQVFLTSNKKPVFYAGEKVYGRLTYSASVYTISLYYDLAGVETAYNTGGAVNLDYILSYRFAFKDIPADMFMSVLQKYPYWEFNDSIKQGKTVEEKLTISAPNTVSGLTYVPTVGTKVTLYINGKAELNTGASPAFTTSGTVITWNATNAEYALATTDVAFARYQTLSQ